MGNTNNEIKPKMLPLAIEDKAKLKTSMTSLSHPRVHKDANIFTSDGENGFSECGR